jgi:tRNA uridine 5-carbamoylmethylation protein Kti12
MTYKILIIGLPGAGKTALANTLQSVLESLGKTCSQSDDENSEYKLFEAVHIDKTKDYDYVIYLNTPNQNNEIYFIPPEKYNYYIDNHQYDLNSSSVVKHIMHLRNDEF